MAGWGQKIDRLGKGADNDTVGRVAQGEPTTPMLYSALRRGAIAQLGERLNGIQKVRGSNPLSSTTNRLKNRRPTTPCRARRGVIAYPEPDA